MYIAIIIVCFFFQAEDGIRDVAVTGVQTCALPISGAAARLERGRRAGFPKGLAVVRRPFGKDGPRPALSETVRRDRKSTRLNSSHGYISYAVFCLKKKKK